MLVRTLTRAAGRLNFPPGREIDLPEADVKELAAAGAVQIIEPPKAEEKADKPDESKPRRTKE